MCVYSDADIIGNNDTSSQATSISLSLLAFFVVVFLSTMAIILCYQCHKRKRRQAIAGRTALKWPKSRQTCLRSSYAQGYRGVARNLCKNGYEHLVLRHGGREQCDDDSDGGYETIPLR